MELGHNASIVFCFPYRGVGGVSYLFGRLANHLAEQGFDISIVDYSDGSLWQWVSDKVKKIDYESLMPNTPLEYDYVIMQGITPWSIYHRLNFYPHTRLIFIATLVENFYPFLPGRFRHFISASKRFRVSVWRTILRSEYKKVQKFIAKLISMQSLICLDHSTSANICEDFLLDTSKVTLMPLFSADVSDHPEFNLRKEGKTTTLNALWVGRLADFKVPILNRVIEDLKQLDEKTSLHFSLTILGTGLEAENLVDLSQCDGLSLERIPNVPPHDLERFMRNYDVVFAMGTSVLDAARIGLPVVRLDYSYQTVNVGYKYRFLHQIAGFSLGDKIDSQYYKIGHYSMAELIHLLQIDWHEIAKKDYVYYREMHQVNNAADKLIAALSKASYSWSEFCISSYKKSFLFNIKTMHKKF